MRTDLENTIIRLKRDQFLDKTYMENLIAYYPKLQKLLRVHIIDPASLNQEIFTDIVANISFKKLKKGLSMVMEFYNWEHFNNIAKFLRPLMRDGIEITGSSYNTEGRWEFIKND